MRVRRSFVASAPFGHRNVTRIPLDRLRPLTRICLPILTRTAFLQATDVIGTQRTAVSRGALERACAALALPSASTVKSTPSTTSQRDLTRIGCHARGP